MGPDASYMTLTFGKESQSDTIEFYLKKIKTPSTAFLSIKYEKEEDILWTHLQSMLKPSKFKQPLIKAKGKAHNFSHFSIEFLGTKDQTPKETTASLYEDSYEVKSLKDQSTQIIKSHFGQLALKDIKFKVRKKEYTMKPFVSNSTGIQGLDHFKIISANFLDNFF